MTPSISRIRILCPIYNALFLQRQKKSGCIPHHKSSPALVRVYFFSRGEKMQLIMEFVIHIHTHTKINVGLSSMFYQTSRYFFPERLTRSLGHFTNSPRRSAIAAIHTRLQEATLFIGTRRYNQWARRYLHHWAKSGPVSSTSRLISRHKNTLQYRGFISCRAQSLVEAHCSIKYTRLAIELKSYVQPKPLFGFQYKKLFWSTGSFTLSVWMNSSTSIDSLPLSKRDHDVAWSNMCIHWISIVISQPSAEKCVNLTSMFHL